MKRLVYFLLVSLLAFASCKKDASNPVDTNTVPSSPTLASPTDTSSNIAVPVVLTWNESSGAKNYTLQVSASSSFSSFVFNKSDITTTTQQISELNYLAVYYWRVRAINSAGTSDWSKVWSFTTTKDEPALVPQLSLPTNGSVDEKVSPVLTWRYVSNANSYALQISTNSSFTSFVLDEDSLITITKQITNLTGQTKYYWRVGAANKFGTKGWSETWSFTTTGSSCVGTPTVTFDGKIYNTVQVGSQCWLKENLDVGTMIQISADASNNGTIEKYCHDNDTVNCTTYGGLYQWNEAMQYIATEKAKGICPIGWHIPTKEEFEILAAAVNNEGNKLKREDQGIGSGVGTNTSGFAALLAGGRDYGLGDGTSYWGSTDRGASGAYTLELWSSNNNIYMDNYGKEHGFSIRCVKD